MRLKGLCIVIIIGSVSLFLFSIEQILDSLGANIITSFVNESTKHLIAGITILFVSAVSMWGALSMLIKNKKGYIYFLISNIPLVIIFFLIDITSGVVFLIFSGIFILSLGYYVKELN